MTSFRGLGGGIEEEKKVLPALRGNGMHVSNNLADMFCCSHTHCILRGAQEQFCPQLGSHTSLLAVAPPLVNGCLKEGRGADIKEVGSL